jgi:uncharacterized protein YbcI
MNGPKSPELHFKQRCEMFANRTHDQRLYFWIMESPMSTLSFQLAIPTSLKPLMKTRGEIEASICEGISRIEQDYVGHGPRNIRAYLLGDLLVVRLNGVLTVAERQLVASAPAEKGRDLLKQVRMHLVETARPLMEAVVLNATGTRVVSLHHDVSTMTGEEVVLFTLADQPCFRGARK